MRRSRARLPSNLLNQYARFDEGILHFVHSCQCQKQPCRKTIFFSPRKTRSGFPGSAATFLLKCHPRARNNLPMVSSRRVSRSRISAMRALLSDRVSVSIRLAGEVGCWIRLIGCLLACGVPRSSVRSTPAVLRVSRGGFECSRLVLANTA